MSLTSNRPHIKVCVPVYDIRTWDISLGKACYTTMCKQTDLPFDLTIAVQQGTIIEEARNLLITESRDNQAIYQKFNQVYTHYLFLDHDIGFTYKDIIKLLEDNKEFVSGAYRPKQIPEQLVAGFFDSNGRVTRYAIPTDTGLQKVNWVGGGFILVRRETLEKMRYPYFWKKVVYLSNRAMCIGEDVFFCLNAQESGIDVWLDYDIHLNHEANRYENETLPDQIILRGDDSGSAPKTSGRKRNKGTSKA